MFDGYFPMLRADLYAMQRAMMTPLDLFLAQVIRAETENTDSVHESAVVADDAPKGES